MCFHGDNHVLGQYTTHPSVTRAARMSCVLFCKTFLALHRFSFFGYSVFGSAERLEISYLCVLCHLDTCERANAVEMLLACGLDIAHLPTHKLDDDKRRKKSFACESVCRVRASMIVIKASTTHTQRHAQTYNTIIWCDEGSRHQQTANSLLSVQ